MRFFRLVQSRTEVSDVSYGRRNVRKDLIRGGDILDGMYLQITMPGIGYWDTNLGPSGGTATPGYVETTERPHYISRLGEFFVEEFQILTGSTEVDKVVNFAGAMWNEVSGSADRDTKRLVLGYDEHDADELAQLQDLSQAGFDLFVPVVMPFNVQGSQISFPASAVTFTRIYVVMSFAQLHSCIKFPPAYYTNALAGTNRTAVVSSPANVTDIQIYEEGATAAPRTLQPNDVELAIISEFAIVTEKERQRMGESIFEILWHQTRYLTHDAVLSGPTKQTIDIDLGGVATSLLFAVQNITRRGAAMMVDDQSADPYNEHFNFTGPTDVGSVWSEPITQFQLRVGGSDVLPTDIPVSYYRLAHKHHYFERTTNNGIYAISLSKRPNDVSAVTGMVNFNALDKVQLILHLNQELNQATAGAAADMARVHVALRTINRFMFTKGRSGQLLA